MLQSYGEFPKILPVIVEEDLFLYPFMIVPLFLSDESNINAVNEALESDSHLVFVTTTKAPSQNKEEAENEEGKKVDSILKEEFYEVGVIGTVMRKVIIPDGRVKILFQGLARGKLLKIEKRNPILAETMPIPTQEYNPLKVEVLLRILKERLKTLYSISQSFPQDLLKSIEENTDANRVVDLIASAIRLKKEQAYRIFKETNLETRLGLLIDVAIEEIDAQKIQKEIKNKVGQQMEKANKEYYLREQLRQIQRELGVDAAKESEIDEYSQKLEKLKPVMPEGAYKEIRKQITKLSRMHSESADANLLQNYVELMLEIPFGSFSTKKPDIEELQRQLDKDHFGLKEPKERIVEYFAVRELLSLRGKDKADSKATILCFYGPPGVGKTSLANSIATALKRKLVRIALGGLEDVNELRGHRRTYIGAMPGRIVQGLIDCKEMNPVVVLDEIDKIHSTYRGDPASVLLEILDTEQNKEFRDYYTNFSIDLSQIIFIATANEIGSIPLPLRDRMEFININSYTPKEKEQIARKYLIPQELKKHGLLNTEVSINAPTLREIIEKYTREAGVRNLRRTIAKIFRKVAKKILGKEEEKVVITPKNLPDFLDKTVFEIESVEKNSQVGVVNGLAWTSVGGDVLKIEGGVVSGNGSIVLTGSLGDVMKESAQIAYSMVRIYMANHHLKPAKNLLEFCKTPKDSKEPQRDVFNCVNLHLHVPEGATPKDGPSAGIAMACVIASIFMDKKIRSDIAMTGEVTLRGKVLPIGGLKEKLIAAYKAGVKEVLIPDKNYKRDIKDIPQEVSDAVKITPVADISQVFKAAFIE